MRLQAISRLAVVPVVVCVILLATPAESRSVTSTTKKPQLLETLTTSSPGRVTIQGPSEASVSGDAELRCKWTSKESSGGAITFGSEEPEEGAEEEEVNRVVWWKDGAMIFSWASGAGGGTAAADASYVGGGGKAKGDIQEIGGKEEKRLYDPAPHVQIDVERSGMDTLYLENLTMESSGRYACAVFFGALRERSIVHRLDVVGSGEAGFGLSEASSMARVAKARGRTNTTTTTTAPPPVVTEVPEVITTPKSPRKSKAEAGTGDEAQGTEGILKAMLLEMVKQSKAMESRLEVEQKTFELKKQEMEFLKGLKRSPVRT